MVEREVMVNGKRIHVVESGSSEPAILMLHGGGPGSNGWTNFSSCIPLFEDRGKVVVPDQPGFGGSEFIEQDGSYLDLSADSMISLLDCMGLERVHIIGNSLGGGVALSMARDHPDRVEKLVVMNPSGASVPLLQTDAPEMGMIRNYYEPPGPSLDRMRAFAAEMVQNMSRLPEGLVQERYNLSLQDGAREGMLRAMASFDPREQVAEAKAARHGLLWTQLQAIDVPVLLLWGREDRAAPLDRAWFVEARLPNAHLHVLPDCGHWIQLEWPQKFATLVWAFLEL